MSIKNWDLVGILEEIKMVQKHETFVVADIETTGFHPHKGAEIIQIASAKVEDGQIVDRFNTYVKPISEIPAKITELTGITNDDVKDAPSIEEALHSFVSFAEDFALVFHNAKFDWVTFLSGLFRKYNYNTNRDVLCTFQTFYKALPGLGKGSYTNEKMAEHFGYTLENAHKADADVEATAYSLIGLKENFEPLNIEEIENKKKEEEADSADIEIKSVNYWSKKIEDKVLKRQYVNLNSKTIGRGTVFYDIVEKEWRNKNYPGRLSYELVQKLVFKYIGVSSIEELTEYRQPHKVG